MYTHTHTHTHTIMTLIVMGTHTLTNIQMTVTVESLTVTVEQEMPGGYTLPVLSVRMGDKSSKAFQMNLENWTTNVRHTDFNWRGKLKSFSLSLSLSLSLQLGASAKVSLVMMYYSLMRDVWEPILEPIMDPKDDKAPPVLWFMKIDVCVATPPHTPFLLPLKYPHVHATHPLLKPHPLSLPHPFLIDFVSRFTSSQRPAVWLSC